SPPGSRQCRARGRCDPTPGTGRVDPWLQRAELRRPLRNRASLARRRTGLLPDRRERGASRRPFSRSKLLLDLFLGDQLAGFGLTESFLDLGQEAEPVDRVLEGRIVGQVAQSFEGQLLFGLRGHGAE